MYIRRSHRILIGLAIALAVAAAVVAWRGPTVVNEAQDAASALLKKASSPPPPSAEEQKRSQARRTADVQGKPAAVPTQPRKCIQNGKTIYTDAPCPAGSEEQVVPENLSVVPGSAAR
ncbi:hypothetical protein D3C72_1354150 [compost metagenome]